MPQTRTRPSAEELARKQKEISVAEFFERNKHILGFDNLSKSMLTAVKEAVDNSLDACEEVSILPEILVEIRKEKNRDEYKLIIEDNGPGIVKRQIPNVFARLLFGSRFHAVRQSRGQQGIGISAVVMYGQMTTGKSTFVKSKTRRADAANTMKLMLDTKRNMPTIVSEDMELWDKESGTRFEVSLKAKYNRGRQSPVDYLKGTAIVNPHARITLIEPDGTEIVFERASQEAPHPTREIRPHPYGLELGQLTFMLKETKHADIPKFLMNEFSSVGARAAGEIVTASRLPKSAKPKELSLEQARGLLEAMQEVKLFAPPTDCLSPIGELLIKKGLKNVLGKLKPEFYSPPVTREPCVYTGNPFQVEVGIVYGGDMSGDQPVQILRFANRVPLLYSQGGCVTTRAIESVDWRRYGLDQRGGHGIPVGAAMILVHVASTKIPFTSESKEAITDVETIRDEIIKALQACGRKLKTHLNKKSTRSKTREKFEIVQKVLPKIAERASTILDKPVPPLEQVITKIMNVVWIDDTISFEKRKYTVSIKMYNYTPRERSFGFFAVFPEENLNAESISPMPKKILSGGRVEWEIKKMAPTAVREFIVELEGLDRGDFDDNELYINGINAVHVLGAEPLPGDWGIKVFRVPEKEEKDDDDSELDYDEASSKDEVTDDE